MSRVSLNRVDTDELVVSEANLAVVFEHAEDPRHLACHHRHLDPIIGPDDRLRGLADIVECEDRRFGIVVGRLIGCDSAEDSARWDVVELKLDAPDMDLVASQTEQLTRLIFAQSDPGLAFIGRVLEADIGRCILVTIVGHRPDCIRTSIVVVAVVADDVRALIQRVNDIDGYRRRGAVTGVIRRDCLEFISSKVKTTGIPSDHPRRWYRPWRRTAEIQPVRVAFSTVVDTDRHDSGVAFEPRIAAFTKDIVRGDGDVDDFTLRDLHVVRCHITIDIGDIHDRIAVIHANGIREDDIGAVRGGHRQIPCNRAEADEVTVFVEGLPLIRPLAGPFIPNGATDRGVERVKVRICRPLPLEPDGVNPVIGWRRQELNPQIIRNQQISNQDLPGDLFVDRGKIFRCRGIIVLSAGFIGDLLQDFLVDSFTQSNRIYHRIGSIGQCDRVIDTDGVARTLAIGQCQDHSAVRFCLDQLRHSVDCVVQIGAASATRLINGVIQQAKVTCEVLHDVHFVVELDDRTPITLLHVVDEQVSCRFDILKVVIHRAGVIQHESDRGIYSRDLTTSTTHQTMRRRIVIANTQDQAVINHDIAVVVTDGHKLTAKISRSNGTNLRRTLCQKRHIPRAKRVGCHCVTDRDRHSADGRRVFATNPDEADIIEVGLEVRHKDDIRAIHMRNGRRILTADGEEHDASIGVCDFRRPVNNVVALAVGHVGQVDKVCGYRREFVGPSHDRRGRYRPVEGIRPSGLGADKRPVRWITTGFADIECNLPQTEVVVRRDIEDCLGAALKRLHLDTFLNNIVDDCIRPLIVDADRARMLRRHAGSRITVHVAHIVLGEGTDDIGAIQEFCIPVAFDRLERRQQAIAHHALNFRKRTGLAKFTCSKGDRKNIRISHDRRHVHIAGQEDDRRIRRLVGPERQIVRHRRYVVNNPEALDETAGNQVCPLLLEGDASAVVEEPLPRHDIAQAIVRKDSDIIPDSRLRIRTGANGAIPEVHGIHGERCRGVVTDEAPGGIAERIVCRPLHPPSGAIDIPRRHRIRASTDREDAEPLGTVRNLILGIPVLAVNGIHIIIGEPDEDTSHRRRCVNVHRVDDRLRLDVGAEVLTPGPHIDIAVHAGDIPEH